MMHKFCHFERMREISALCMRYLSHVRSFDMTQKMSTLLLCILVVGLTACTRHYEGSAVQEAASIDHYDHSDGIRDEGIFSKGYVRADD